MSLMMRALIATLTLFVVVLAYSASRAETLTAETRKLLDAMKLGPEILNGLDRELAVPQQWVDAAKKEGVVNVRMTLTEEEFAQVAPVFEARYPGVKTEYKRGVGRERALAPLLAFKRSTVVSDTVFAHDSLMHEYRKAKALVDLRPLPAFSSVPKEFSDPEGIWVAAHMPHYCLSYNTKTVKKAELPKTWDELLTNPRWRNGKVGMAVNVHTWILPLWGVKGDAWTDDYMNKIFTVLKPQLRKERLSMTPRLNALGEYDVSVPAGDYAVRPYEDQGMPVSLHCPSPVPKTITSIGIISGTPNLNAAKLFVNWALSKEGQITLVHAGQIVPSHKDLQLASLLPYPKEVLGKPLAPVDDRVRQKTPELAARWQELWTSAGRATAEHKK